jgi:hypothetical protein
MSRMILLERITMRQVRHVGLGSCVNLRLTQDPVAPLSHLTKNSFSRQKPLPKPVGPPTHALGKARPHGRPGLRGAGRPYGFASGPLGTACSFSIVTPSSRANSGGPDSIGLGATIEKEHAAPRGPEAEGRRDGRRPCAQVACEGELSLVRAREGLLNWKSSGKLF